MVKELKEEKAFPDSNVLTIPTIEPKLHVKIIAPDGKVRVDKDLKTHSFVRNWYSLYIQSYCFIGARTAYGLTVKDTLGTTYSSGDGNGIGIYNVYTNFIAPAGEATYGLQVGTNDTAWDITNFVLGALITHGTGAGQLSYAATPAVTKVDVGAVRTISVKRNMNNNGSGDVIVREIGYTGGGIRNYKTALSYEFLLLRDVLETPETLVPAEQLQLTLDFVLTFPETIS